MKIKKPSEHHFLILSTSNTNFFLDCLAYLRLKFPEITFIDKNNEGKNELYATGFLATSFIGGWMMRK